MFDNCGAAVCVTSTARHAWHLPLTAGVPRGKDITLKLILVPYTANSLISHICQKPTYSMYEVHVSMYIEKVPHVKQNNHYGPHILSNYEYTSSLLHSKEYTINSCWAVWVTSWSDQTLPGASFTRKSMKDPCRFTSEIPEYCLMSLMDTFWVDLVWLWVLWAVHQLCKKNSLYLFILDPFKFSMLCTLCNTIQYIPLYCNTIVSPSATIVYVEILVSSIPLCLWW